MRKIRTPQICTNSVQGFCMIAKKDFIIAITNKLTASQWKLWAYLMIMDPFADHNKDGERIYKSLPSPQEIADQIGLCYHTVVKDMRKLRKYQLYDYRVIGWQGYNQSAHHAKQEVANRRQASKTFAPQTLGLINPIDRLNNPNYELNNPDNGLNSPKNGLNNPKLIPEVLPDKDYSSSQTIQTKQTKHTSLEENSRREKEKFEEEKNIFELPTTSSCSVTPDETLSIERSYKLETRNNVSKCNINIKNNSVNVYTNWTPPPGDWNLCNRLDPSFHQWLATKWARKFNAKIQEARANVVLCFMNNPDKLPIQWNRYQEELSAKVNNAKVRLNSGYTISSQEQVEVTSRVNVIKPCNQSSSSPESLHNSVQEEYASSTEKIPVNPTALRRLKDFMTGFSTSKIVEVEHD